MTLASLEHFYFWKREHAHCVGLIGMLMTVVSGLHFPETPFRESPCKKNNIIDLLKQLHQFSYRPLMTENNDCSPITQTQLKVIYYKSNSSEVKVLTEITETPVTDLHISFGYQRVTR